MVERKEMKYLETSGKKNHNVGEKHSSMTPGFCPNQGADSPAPLKSNPQTSKEIKTEEPQKWWYALRVTYQRELKVKEELEQRKLKCFLPMTMKLVERNGERKKIRVPAVSNLLFVNITKEEMQLLKKEQTLPIRYIMDREKRVPVVIPDRQMENFIRVAQEMDQKQVYISSDELKTLKKGTKVRITEGPMAGVEGEFVRVKHDRRVVVKLQNMMAIGTGFIKAEWLERIEE